MLRKENEAVSEGNGPVHQEDFGFGQPALADEYREIKSLSKQQEIRLDKITRLLEHLSSCLEREARQPRLAMEKADGPANTKTRERTEGATTAVQAMHGDSCTARKVLDGPKTSTSCDMKAEPPALPCRDDILVEDGTAAPKSRLPSLEMRSPSAAGGLVPTGETSTATQTTVNEPLLQFYSIKEENSKNKNLWTSTPSASYDSSVFRKRNLAAAPYCWRVIETKPRQNRTFDPGGSQGRLRACPFLGP